MIGRKTLLWGFAAATACAAAYGVFSDTLVMTAFYPSPTGNYWKLLSTDATTLARDKSFVAVGIDPRKLAVSSKFVVQGNPGGTSELSVTDSNKNPLLYVGENGAGTHGVGVGTTNPQAAVDVGLSGGVKLAPGGTCASAADTGKIGMIGSPATPQWCDGSKWQPLTGNSTSSTTHACIPSVDSTCACTGPPPCACPGGGVACYIVGQSPSCPGGTQPQAYYSVPITAQYNAGNEMIYCAGNSPGRWGRCNDWRFGGCGYTHLVLTCSTPNGWVTNIPQCSPVSRCYYGDGTVPAGQWSIVKCQ